MHPAKKRPRPENPGQRLFYLHPNIFLIKSMIADDHIAAQSCCMEVFQASDVGHTADGLLRSLHTVRACAVCHKGCHSRGGNCPLWYTTPDTLLG